MERVIESIKFNGSNIKELQNAITKLTQAARIACNGQNWHGMEAVHLQDEDGFSVTHLELIEETLTDKSKVYDVRLFFAVPDFSQPDGIAKEEFPELAPLELRHSSNCATKAGAECDCNDEAGY